MVRQRHAANRRRRILRWMAVAILPVALVAWSGYTRWDAGRIPPPPSSDISAAAGPASWPMLGRDPTHAAVVAGDGAGPKGEILWRFETDAPIESSPAVVDGRVYLATGDSRVIALDAGSGEPVWESRVSGPVAASPAVAGGLVFVGLRDGDVLALNRATGDVQWRFETDGFIHSSPAVYEGVLYVGAADNRVYALDALTGEKRWSYETGGWILAAPAVHGNLLAVPSEDGYLYVLDRRSGQKKLDYRIAIGGSASALTDSVAFLTDAAGVLSAVDWRDTDPPLEKATQRIKVQLFAWGLMEDISSQAGTLWSSRPSAGRFVGTPAAGDGKVYVATDRGALYAVDASTGQRLWEFNAERGSATSPSVVYGTALVGHDDGRLHGVDAATGESQWSVLLDGGISSVPVFAGGTIYVATRAGTLYALR